MNFWAFSFSRNLASVAMDAGMWPMYTVFFAVLLLRSFFIAAKVWHMMCSGVLFLTSAFFFPFFGFMPLQYTPATARQAEKIRSTHWKERTTQIFWLLETTKTRTATRWNFSRPRRQDNFAEGLNVFCYRSLAVAVGTCGLIRTIGQSTT